MKKKLADLKTTIGEIDALMRAKASITDGATITEKAKARAIGGIVTEGTTIVGESGPEIVSLPYGSVVRPSSVRSSGSVVIHIGAVHVHDEADEDRFMEKIARQMQLLQMNAA
jgi:hypothetical protein